MRFPDFTPMVLVATLVAAAALGAVSPASAHGDRTPATASAPAKASTAAR